MKNYDGIKQKHIDSIYANENDCYTRMSAMVNCIWKFLNQFFVTHFQQFPAKMNKKNIGRKHLLSEHSREHPFMCHYHLNIACTNFQHTPYRRQYTTVNNISHNHSQPDRPRANWNLCTAISSSLQPYNIFSIITHFAGTFKWGILSGSTPHLFM